MTSASTTARAVAVAAVAVVLAGLLAIVVAARGDDVPRAGARATVDGRATVVHVDGTASELESGDIVRAGEEVRVDDGTVVLELAAGGAVEGRAGFDGGAASRILMGERPEVLAGEALLSGAEGLDVTAGGTVLEVSGDDGAARVERGLAVTAASYRGALAVDSAGQERDVPALRQLGIATPGRPPARPRPLRYVEADPWDLRFLGPAIELSRQLDAVSTTFTAQTPAGAATAAYLGELFPELAGQPSSVRTRLEQGTAARPAGEAVVGAAIAAAGDDGSLAERWDAVFDFREDGAKWGLVVLDRGTDARDVLALLSRALDRAFGSSELALGLGALAAADADPLLPGTTATTPDGGGGGGDGGGRGGGGGGSTPGRTPGTGSPPGSRPPGGIPGLPGLPGLPGTPTLPTVPPTLVPDPLAPTVPSLPPVSEVIDPVTDVLDPVTDVLPPPVTQVVDDVLDGVTGTVDDVLSGVTGTVNDVLGGAGSAVNDILGGGGSRTTTTTRPRSTPTTAPPTTSAPLPLPTLPPITLPPLGLG